MIKKLLMMIIFIFLFAQPVLAVPGDWWGTVKINNKHIADNSIVTVYVNENTTPNTSSIVGQLKTDYYLVHVEAKTGDNIKFKVNNIFVEQSNQIWSDGDHELNLSIIVNDSYSSSVSTVANQNTTINAVDKTNTSLDFTTNVDVTGSINIIKYHENPKTSGFGVISLNKYIQIETTPEIVNALSWAIIKIYYTDNEINSLGINESSLRIYYYNSTSGNWMSYNPPVGGVDTTENYVWANTTHFSYYGAGGMLADGQTCNSGSDCYSNYCVHNVCRSSSPYCGDSYCDSGESCGSCSIDCGSCPTPAPPIVTGGTGGGGGGGGAGGTTTTKKECNESWSCSEWSTCIGGKQTRTCNDLNKCNTTKSKPLEDQSCQGQNVTVEKNATISTNETSRKMPTGFAVFTSYLSNPITISVIIIAIVIGVMYWKKLFLFKKAKIK